MFSVLPDLIPRDSHTLWYTSSRNPNTASTASLDPLHHHHNDAANPTNPNPNATGTNNNNNNNNNTNPRMRSGPAGQGSGAAAAVIDRSALGRLRDDERMNERRRLNVANLGSTWLKPPGVGKTLFQLREERREAEEHAEALRREMLAQELAEAEAAGAAGAGGGVVEGVEGGLDGGVLGMDGDGDEMMEDGGGRDLDDDIPDADDGGFGFDGASDEDEDGDEEEEEEEGEEEGMEAEEEDGDENEVSRVGEGSASGQQMRRVQQRELANRVATIRATEERMRQMMVRGSQRVAANADLYGADEEIDEEDQEHILEEDDLVGEMYPEEMEPGADMDMDADLDDDIPEAESGGYEHTDSEASLSSDEGASHNVSYAGMQAPRLPHPRSSMAGGAAPRSSLNISSILSGDGSSVMGSSPRLQRRN